MMTMASFCGRLVLRLFGWRLVGTVPPISKFVFIGAPHTSNWVLLVMLAAGAALGQLDPFFRLQLYGD